MQYPIPKPIFTTVPVKGLKRDFKILHFTDLHACALDEDEKATMEPVRRDYIPPRQGLFGGRQTLPLRGRSPRPHGLRRGDRRRPHPYDGRHH